MAAKKKKKKYRFFWKFVKIQLLAALVIVIGAVGWYCFGGYAAEVKTMQSEAVRLVRASSYDTFKVSQTSIVYAADGQVISKLKGGKDSYYLSIDEIPESVKQAIVSIEDKRFFRHNGIDYRALVRAVRAMAESGEVTQGGSTITMQLARNIFLTQEKTWQRKMQEMCIARELEKKYTKDEILEFYLNNIYFGNGYYGIQSASRGYFNRNVQDLDLSQAAFLCAVPNNPTVYDPVTNMDHARSRRDRILKNMLEDEKISGGEYEQATTENIILERPAALTKNDYVETYTYYCATRALMENEDFHFRYDFASEEDRQYYEEAYGALYAECQKKLYTAGYRIYTTLDLTMQNELQWAVDRALADNTEVNEEGVYALQSSAVCVDNESGFVKAIVGGRSQDFSGYTLNRAYQSFRQPGSAIKPLSVYTPIFEQNYTPDSLVVDAPIEDGPKNANGTYAGEMTIRTAVEHSVNTIAWNLYQELTPAKGLSYLERMNFSKLDREDERPATALGGFTNGVSALEMAAGYAALANDGMYRTPTCIAKILDAQGSEIYTCQPEEKRVYQQNSARMMTDVLQGVLTNGTGKGLGLGDMPCAGKTGTTNEKKDGWFVGYTRYYTTSVWVGYDMPRKMADLMGYTYPGKIWQSFMQWAHVGLEPLAFLPYVKPPELLQEDTEDTENAGEELLGEPEDEQVDETEQNPENAPDSGSEAEQNPENEAEQNPVNEIEQNPENEPEQNPVNEIEQNPENEIGQNPENVPNPGITPENPPGSVENPQENDTETVWQEEMFEDVFQ